MGQRKFTILSMALAAILTQSGTLRAADSSSFSLEPMLASASEPSTDPAGTEAQVAAAPPAQAGHQPAFELPAITVNGEKASDLREEDRVGSYGQPRWTATRRFPGTRVYVIPENAVEGEVWFRPTFERDGRWDYRNLYELEFGLPHRFQLDMYYRSDTDEEGVYHNGAQLEMRYAFAEWGKIWGNPTLYLEYAPLEKAPDTFEARLLLGDELAPRWHWGLNLNAEWELSGEEGHEYQISGGLSYTVVDEKFSVGGEFKALFTDHLGSRGTFDDVYLIGPSIQWRPHPQLTVNIAPLAGVGPNSPDAEITLNVGWDF